MQIPKDTPGAIVYALENASKTRFCTLIGNLEFIENDKEYTIEAYIGPYRCSFNQLNAPRFKVKLLIPECFPFGLVHVVPIEPELRWFPHQNGDWPVDGHRNAICPPKDDQVDISEYLLPYLRQAYDWITDASDNVSRIAKPGDRYEFPEIRPKSNIEILVEGGCHQFETIKNIRFGQARVNEVNNSSSGIVLRVIEFTSLGAGKDIVKSELIANAFGDESTSFWAPWVYVGDPVVKYPHKPPTKWTEFPEKIQNRILRCIYVISKPTNLIKFVLLGFMVPLHVLEKPSCIYWCAIKLNGYNCEKLKVHSRRFIAKLNTHPAYKLLAKKNETLEWFPCKEISINALSSRANYGGDMSDHTIAIIGIGALGSLASKSLSKMNYKKIILMDHENIEPGNLCRHEAGVTDIGTNKAEAINKIIKSPTTETEGYNLNILNNWDLAAEILNEATIILDATANQFVHQKIHQYSIENKKAAGYFYVKPGPDYGLLYIKHKDSDCDLYKAEERLKTLLPQTDKDAFFKDNKSDDEIVWPEAGCYDPTFIAPYHRLRIMADSIVNSLYTWGNSSNVSNLLIVFTQIKSAYGIESKIIVEESF